MTDKPAGKRPWVRCGGDLRQGYIAEHGEFDSVFQLKWHPGVPRSWSLLGFLKFERKGSDDWIALNTYRCATCGYVELIAS
jgi:hypothetical protein